MRFWPSPLRQSYVAARLLDVRGERDDDEAARDTRGHRAEEEDGEHHVLTRLEDAPRRLVVEQRLERLASPHACARTAGTIQTCATSLQLGRDGRKHPRRREHALARPRTRSRLRTPAHQSFSSDPRPRPYGACAYCACPHLSIQAHGRNKTIMALIMSLPPAHAFLLPNVLTIARAHK
eukprot:6199546-Pleurochrysis_carterae.AAC.5